MEGQTFFYICHLETECKWEDNKEERRREKKCKMFEREKKMKQIQLKNATQCTTKKLIWISVLIHKLIYTWIQNWDTLHCTYTHMYVCVDIYIYIYNTYIYIYERITQPKKKAYKLKIYENFYRKISISTREAR